MRIENLRLERSGDTARASARATWEDSDRPARDIYIEVSGPAASDLTASPDAFLLGAVIPAFHHGERRIFVEGAVCPVLRDGAAAAMMYLREWFGPDRPPAAIEASQGFRAADAPRPRAVASFLSGGVDSLFTLRKNTLEIPAGHSAAIREVIQIFGHDVSDPDAWPWMVPHADAVRRAVRGAAEDAGVALVPVRFNLRLLEPDVEFYIRQSSGASIAAAAHALSRRFETVLHPSSLEAGLLIGTSQNPALDFCYGSATLAFRHDGLAFTRSDKLRLVAQWPAGLRALRVCNSWAIREGFLNCGACEKCLRTRIGLLLLGRLAEATSFPGGDIAPEEILSTDARRDFEIFWRELVAPLRQAGRGDLARAVEARIRLHRREQAWFRDAGIKGALRRLDRRCLGGRLLAARRRMRGKG